MNQQNKVIIQQWMPNRLYTTPTTILYKNITYQLIQTHMTCYGWEPNMTENILWRSVFESKVEENVYSNLVSRLGQDLQEVKVNPANILPIVANTVSLVEKYSSAVGEEKKIVATHVISKLLENVQINDREYVSTFLTNQLSVTIDALVSMAKGEFKTNYEARHFFEKLDCFKK